ncbi:hypothetical protein [Sphingomonas oleivorans]|nr:hypothetical protein [Sphingomonas oleivorans]
MLAYRAPVVTKEIMAIRGLMLAVPLGLACWVALAGMAIGVGQLI